jgi:hypothetical protein
MGALLSCFDSVKKTDEFKQAQNVAVDMVGNALEQFKTEDKNDPPPSVPEQTSPPVGFRFVPDAP